jgi:hypothetical protein
MSRRIVCDKCGASVIPTQIGPHRQWKCPAQNKGLARLVKSGAVPAPPPVAKPPPTFWQYLPCLCGCPEPVGQVKGRRKRQFVDDSHYDKWRRAAEKAAAEGEPDLMAQRKNSEEVAALRVKEATIAREAGMVRMLSPEASFALWARCLGFTSPV